MQTNFPGAACSLESDSEPEILDEPPTVEPPAPEEIASEETTPEELEPLEPEPSLEP